MSTTKPPKYDRSIERLARAYRKAIKAILAELDRIDIPNLTRVMGVATLVEVTKILRDLNAESAAWVAENIPVAVRDGVLSALVALDGEDAVAVETFSRLNRDLVKTAVADTQSDLLAVTQNVERRVRTAIRQVTGDVIRSNLAEGINGHATLKRETLTGLRKRLGDSVNTGIVDAAGRRWRPEVYVDMAVRTKMMITHREATTNEAVDRGVFYGRISKHGATDACSKYEGAYVKLVPDAPGLFPYIGDLPRREIFHPNCKHLISPIRKPPGLDA